LNVYPIHKGKLDCFQQTGDEQKFAEELEILRKLAGEYRQHLREDDSRQAFFFFFFCESAGHL